MNGNRIAAGIAALVILSIIAPFVAVAEPASLQSNSPGTAHPGEEVTVSFTLQNTGDNDSAYIVNIDSIPNGWNVVGHQDDGGTWKDSDTRWLFQTVEPSENRFPSVTFQIPSGESPGDYTVSAVAEDDQGPQDSTSTTITVQERTPTPTPTEAESRDPERRASTPTPTASPTPTDEPETPTPTDEPETPTPTDEPETPTPTDEPETPSETPEEDDGISTFLIVLVVLILLAVAAGVAYYAYTQQ